MRFAKVVLFGVALAWAGAALAAPETPAAFVKRLEAKYRAMDRWPQGYEPCSEFCEPALWRLVGHANDHDDVLDYDPFCQCQDVPPGLPVRTIAMNGAYGAQVTLQRTGEDGATWVYVLHRGGGRWQIADVIEKGRYGLGSLKARLAHPPK